MLFILCIFVDLVLANYKFRGHFYNFDPHGRHYNIHIPDPISYSHPHDELKRIPYEMDLRPFEDISYDLGFKNRIFEHKHYRSPELPVHALYNVYPYLPLTKYDENPSYRGITYLMGISRKARITVPVCVFSSICVK